PSALLRGSSLPCEASREDGHRDLSREYRRCVYRDRMEVRLAGSQEAPGILERRDAEGWEEADSLGLRHRHQTHLANRNKAAGAQSHQIRAGSRAQKRDTSA